MTSTVETHGAIITLDLLPIGQAHNPLAWLHKHQGQSADYALKHGGYGIETRDNVVRGYMAYLLVKERQGYSVNGHLVRSIESLQEVSLTEGGKFTTDYLFTERVAAPQLSAIRMLLNYTEGHLAIINSELDSWVMLAAKRFGIDPDNV